MQVCESFSTLFFYSRSRVSTQNIFLPFRCFCSFSPRLGCFNFSSFFTGFSAFGPPPFAFSFFEIWSTWKSESFLKPEEEEGNSNRLDWGREEKAKKMEKDTADTNIRNRNKEGGNVGEVFKKL